MNKKKIRLAILRELEKGNKGFSNIDFDISTDELIDILNWLKNENLINDYKFFMDESFYFEKTEVTLKGEKYFAENSAALKTYKGLKEIRDWIPFY
ncbi:hypothetical protein J8TS2_35720 [Lederbergia ruris]|uniref:Uncharacterized protein n=1 Tax=Lederbergia ruris TaxID=217495 RepID=A0ABQ4KMU8_9BACI|nr:YjcQ family protein [Lederbergia ruris]GIN59253.1 hypothetical protein J8TS2_35720 [Lederbergia ruris]